MQHRVVLFIFLFSISIIFDNVFGMEESDHVIPSENCGIRRPSEIPRRLVRFSEEEQESRDNNQGLFEPIFDGEDIRNYQRLDDDLIVSLLDNAPAGLRLQIELMKNPVMYRSLNVIEKFVINKILLYGPPGSGKSSLAKAIADYCNFPRQFINSSSILNQYKNSGQSNLRHIFKQLFSNDCYVAIIFDELTGLTNKRASKNDADHGTIEEFLKIFDHCERYKNVLVIATTNDIKNLPEPIKDRFCGCMFKVEAPDLERRKKYIKRLLGNHKIQENENLKRISLEFLKVPLLHLSVVNDFNTNEEARIVKLTENFSMRQLNAMANWAIILALRRCLDETFMINGNTITVTMEDYRDAIAIMKHSSSACTKHGLEKIAQYIKDFSPHLISIVHVCIGVYLQYLSMQWQYNQSVEQTEWHRRFQEQSHNEIVSLNERHHWAQMDAQETHYMIGHAIQIFTSCVGLSLTGASIFWGK